MKLPMQNVQPLSPVACALALLPRQGQLVIPKPLQHLMDVGSPIEDMFDECPVKEFTVLALISDFRGYCSVI